MGRHAVSAVDGSGMPSFSRSGKNSSNSGELAAVNAAFDRDRAEKARGRPGFSYRSLAETPGRLTNFTEDLGRNALISSSPRVQEGPSANTAKSEGLIFQRVMRWSTVPGEDYNPDALQGGAGGNKKSSRGQKEDQKAKKVVDRLNHFFLATERGAPNDYLEQFNKQVGKLAPPVGYYDVKMDLTKPAGPRLGYIVQVDRPHAPTFIAETLLKETLAKSKKELTLKGKTAQAEEDFQISPRAAVRLLRDKSPNVTDLSQCSFQSTKSHNKKEKLHTAQPKLQEDEGDDNAKTAMSPDKGVTIMSPVASPDLKIRPRTSTPTSGSRIFDKKWDASHVTINMKGRVARTKESTGESTCTGYQMSTAQSADVWYRPSFEVMEITGRRVSTPDLSRSGKDFDDHLLRLGFQLPQTLAQSPWYSKVDSAMDWSNMPGWYTSTNLMDNRTAVQIGKQTQRRSLEQKAVDTGVRIQYRKPTRNISTIGYKEKHPQYPHVPGPNLQKSTSAHGDIAAFKSITTQLKYNPSHRLQHARTTDVLYLKKMGSRQPLTAHPFNGKPVRNISDAVYDTHEAEMQKIRPRTQSPVDMYRRPGREAWGGSNGTPASGALTGLSYWDGIHENTSSVSKLSKSRMPDLNLTQGREAYNPRDTADRESRFFAATLDAHVKPPISKVGKLHFDTGQKTGALWHPK